MFAPRYIAEPRASSVTRPRDLAPFHHQEWRANYGSPRTLLRTPPNEDQPEDPMHENTQRHLELFASTWGTDAASLVADLNLAYAAKILAQRSVDSPAIGTGRGREPNEVAVMLGRHDFPAVETIQTFEADWLTILHALSRLYDETVPLLWAVLRETAAARGWDRCPISESGLPLGLEAGPLDLPTRQEVAGPTGNSASTPNGEFTST
ncbi:hypothetical protein P7C70_g2066, partial [Phenoliferia sp. Uapishka_3]